MFDAREDHAGDPEEDDVVPAGEHVGGIEVVEIFRLFGIAEGGEGPQRRGKPSIQHVFVLLQIMAAAVRAGVGIRLGADDLAAILTIPDGDAVPPPELAGDAPVSDPLHPVVVDLREALGGEFDLFAGDGVDGGLCERLHADEPLLGDDGLHRALAAVAVPDVVAVRLDLHEGAAGFEVFDDAFAGGEAIHPLVFARFPVHRAVVVHHADDFQIVAKPHFEVVGVVRGRDLDRARAEFHVDVIVGDDRDLPPHEGQDERFSHHVRIALVFGVDRDGGVAQHGLGTGRRDNDGFAAVFYGVFEMPEERRVFAVFHFRVRKCGFTARAPVDDAVSPVNEPFFVEVHEHFAHRFGTALVHRESEARPIRRNAHLFELFDDAPAVFFLPVPGAAQKLFPADVLLGQAPFYHLVGDLDLRSGGSVDATRKVQRGIPLHPLEADEGVDDGIVERVPEMELPRYVGGRNDDRKRDLGRVCFRTEVVFIHPFLIKPVLEIFGIVSLLHFHNRSFL